MKYKIYLIVTILVILNIFQFNSKNEIVKLQSALTTQSQEDFQKNLKFYVLKKDPAILKSNLSKHLGLLIQSLEKNNCHQRNIKDLCQNTYLDNLVLKEFLEKVDVTVLPIENDSKNKDSENTSVELLTKVIKILNFNEVESNQVLIQTKEL